MRETRTCSLGGGRRPARERASSDPTMVRWGVLDDFRIARDPGTIAKVIRPDHLCDLLATQLSLVTEILYADQEVFEAFVTVPRRMYRTIARRVARITVVMICRSLWIK